MRPPQFTAPLRPNRRPKAIWRECPADMLTKASSTAIYEGSAYHRPRGAGQAAVGRNYKTASRCSEGWTIEAATDALREAIRKGFVSSDWRSDFPRNVWYKQGSVVYEAFLHNEGLGAYHAYPLHEEEWPVGLAG